MPAENMTEAGAPLAPPIDDTTLTAGESIVDRLTGSGVEADEPLLPVKEPAWPGPDADAAPPAMSVPPATPVPPDKQEAPATQEAPAAAEPGGPVDVAEPASPADSVGTPDVEDTAGSVTVPSVGTPPPDDSVEATEPAPDVAAGKPPVDEPEEVSGSGGTMAAPAKQADGWQIDRYQLRSFTDAVVRTRSYLDSVQAKVERMQGAELTPQIGTSPVGQQLAKKFDDRLNSADGLRAMLTEAMKRMDDFVASAEAAARAYDEVEEDTVDTVGAGGKVDAPPGKG